MLGLYYSNFANFGDALNPLLVEKLSGQRVVYRNHKNAQLMAVGSIFYGGGFFWGPRGSFLSHQQIRICHRRLLDLWHGPMHVWGSGVLYDLPVNEKQIHYRRLVVHAVRGKETERILRQIGVLSASATPVLGDPGLLYPDLVSDWQSIRKDYDVVLVPHYLDYQIGVQLGSKIETKGLKVRVVDVMQRDPLQVIREIASGKVVLSASLHGLIVADSMGIPNRHLVLSDYEIDRKYGEGAFLLKFQDYYSSLGLSAANYLSPEIVLKDTRQCIENVIHEYGDRLSVVRDIKKRLLDVFPFKK